MSLLRDFDKLASPLTVVHPAEESMTKFTAIGRNLPKVDGLHLVTGQAKFTADYEFDDLLFCKILRSPLPHANIVNIDASRVRKHARVKGILTNRDPGSSAIWEPPDVRLLDNKVRCVGDEVAAVAATDPFSAADALELFRVEYQDLPRVFTPEQALSLGAPEVRAGGNLVGGKPLTGGRGDVIRGFEEAEVIVEGNYSFHGPNNTVAAAAMEPKAALAKWEGDELTVWLSTSTIFKVREQLARFFGLELSKVRIISNYVGGSFGSKGEDAGRYLPITAQLAKTTGDPVLTVLTREEESMRTRHPTSTYVKIGAKRDGTLTAIYCRELLNKGPYEGKIGLMIAAKIARPVCQLYRCPNVSYEAYSVYTNSCFIGVAFRGFGTPQPTLAVSSALDELAKKLGIPTPDLMRKVHAKAGDPMSEPGFDHGPILNGEAYDECIDAGASRMGATSLGRGQGMSLFIHGCTEPVIHASAKIVVDPKGTIGLHAGITDQGAGQKTTQAQIAAEVLGLPLESIEVFAGDSNLPTAVASVSSQVTWVQGRVTYAAAVDAKNRLLEAAGKLLGVRGSDLQLDGRGWIRARTAQGGKMTIRDVAEGTSTPIVGSASIMLGGEKGTPFSAVAKENGACFTEVYVDRDTGGIEIEKIVFAQHVGRAINPRIVQQQIEGGVMQALGHTLTEQLVMESSTGRCLNPNLRDYRILTILDVPEIEVVMVEKPDPAGAFGVIGTSEGQMSPVAPAIVNAIQDAIGVRLFSIPITPAKIFDVLGNSK